jgi:heat shock protein HtpX
MNLHQAVSSNIRKTWLIIILFAIFVSAIGYIYGQSVSEYGILYAGIALLFASATSLGSYFYSDTIILASSGAKEVQLPDQPELYRTVENLCIGAGLPLPKIYLIDDHARNAFATGRDPNHAVIAVTTGLLQSLTKSELEGVIAHELSHIKNFDIRLMAVVAVLVGSIALISDIYLRGLLFRGKQRGGAIMILIGIALALLSPLIATLMQLAISRKREYLADASGALLTRYPEGLANALEKIAAYPIPLQKATNATAHLYIANPFLNTKSKHLFSSLFNTHPPIEDRIKLLRNM